MTRTTLRQVREGVLGRGRYRRGRRKRGPVAHSRVTERLTHQHQYQQHEQHTSGTHHHHGQHPGRMHRLRGGAMLVRRGQGGSACALSHQEALERAHQQAAARHHLSLRAVDPSVDTLGGATGTGALDGMAPVLATLVPGVQPRYSYRELVRRIAVGTYRRFGHRFSTARISSYSLRKASDIYLGRCTVPSPPSAATSDAPSATSAMSLATTASSSSSASSTRPSAITARHW
jgi:hypothetical protein